MTFGAFVAICFTLAFVLALIAITMRLLRRVSLTQGGGGALRMEVVQRIGIAPRQGIAVVRVGARQLVVSVGDGGVRTLAELTEADVARPQLSREPSNDVTNFAARLMSGLRDARGRVAHLIVGIVVFGALSVPRAAVAQKTASGAKAAAVDSAVSSAAPTIAEALVRGGPQFDVKLAGPKADGNGLHLSGTVGVVVLMGVLTLLPMLLLLMTSFTRILIVLGFLRQAIGAQAPPAPLVSALALLLTGFVMSPTLAEVDRTALTPWMDGKIDQGAMMSAAIIPFRGFMLRQTRQHDLDVFVEMSHQEPPKRVEDVSTTVLMSAFVTSELRTAFQIGFALFLPFIIIDLVVSSVLMSMGMMMLPPAMVSLPFKLILFVLVDGWSLVIQSLVSSFR